MTGEQGDMAAELTSVGDTETEAAARLAAEPVIVSVGVRQTVALPPGWGLTNANLERFEPTPIRARGRVVVHDAAGFLAAVGRRWLRAGSDPVVYADESANALVAILNDDEAEQAGWRDYRVELALRPTPEWTHWRRHDGQLMTQGEFAQHIEDGLTELVEPPAAEMLEIAQTFNATVDARFKSGTRLSSGAQQFQYEEDVTAKAGTAGTVEVPNRLGLVVAPFYGASRFEVGAWLKYRLSREKFSIGYKLDRPHEVERAAFSEIRAKVNESLDVVFVSGPAPEPTGAPAS